MIVGGIVMWIVDAIYGGHKGGTFEAAAAEEVERMTLSQAIWIGLCQSLSAIFPGLSRSMSTIAAGQIVGMSRPSALEFSFLLSIPTMLAATGYDLDFTGTGQAGKLALAFHGRDSGRRVGACTAF